MSSWIGSAFLYGLGVSAGKAVFGDDRQRERATPREPVHQQTEEEILADEKRYDAEARELDAADAAARATRKQARSHTGKARTVDPEREAHKPCSKPRSPPGSSSPASSR